VEGVALGAVGAAAAGGVYNKYKDRKKRQQESDELLNKHSDRGFTVGDRNLAHDKEELAPGQEIPYLKESLAPEYVDFNPEKGVKQQAKELKQRYNTDYSLREGKRNGRIINGMYKDSTFHNYELSEEDRGYMRHVGI
jgi:hypothetical protein